MRKYIFIFVLISILSIGVQSIATAEEGTNIKVKIDNYKGKQLFLLYHYSKSTLYTDTADINSNNEFVFKNDTVYPGGMYLLLLEDKKTYFEIILDKDQHFAIHTDSLNLVSNIRIKGSEDNQKYYEYLNFITSEKTKLADLQKQKAATTDKSKQNEIDKKLEGLNTEVMKYQSDYIIQYPNHLFTAILKAGQEPELPTVLPKKEDGSPDSTYVFRYYKKHYFDGFGFDDARLVRTSVYPVKIERYFKQLMLKHPDSVIAEGDAIIQKSKGSYEAYKYTIWFFTYKTETSKIMGMDKAFVHFAKKYYVSGEAKWATEGIVNNMANRVKILERLFIGDVAPNLILIDTAKKWVSLHAVPAKYSVVVFWDPDCGHCKTELPIIRDWVAGAGKEYGVKVFAVCSDTNMHKWKKEIIKRNYNFINVNGTRSVTEDYHDLYDIISTPVIYILDEKKKIVAKKVNHIQMQEIIKRDFDRKNKK